MTYKTKALLLLSWLIFFSGEEKRKFNVTNSSIDVKTKLVYNCQCYNGIGSSEKDEPILTYTFSNGKSVSVCGYEHPKSKPTKVLISEFNVFDCQNGKKIVEYGALDNCSIETNNDAIQINLLKNLPAGENWSWKSVRLARQLILPYEDEIIVSELSSNYTPTEIDENQIDAFLSEFKVAQGIDDNWEEIIGKLEVLSLNGNEKAWGLLENYQSFTGVFFDGALAETWKEAVATVKLHKRD